MKKPFKLKDFKTTGSITKEGIERIYLSRYSYCEQEYKEVLNDWYSYIEETYKLPSQIWLRNRNPQLYLSTNRSKFSTEVKKLEKQEQLLEKELSIIEKEYEKNIAPFVEKRRQAREKAKSNSTVVETKKKLLEICPHKDHLLLSDYGDHLDSGSSYTRYQEWCLFCKKLLREYDNY